MEMYSCWNKQDGFVALKGLYHGIEFSFVLHWWCSGVQRCSGANFSFVNLSSEYTILINT